MMLRPLIAILFIQAAQVEALDRPKLQILNAGETDVEVFWVDADGKRVPNGKIAPGTDKIIGTSLGHRFVIMDGGKETEVVSKVPVQTFRYEPAAKDGVPAFYSQVVHAHGYPICASAKVSPYALKEAAYLADLMLAKRPDVREAMIASGSRLCILAHDEFTTDQPEWAWLGKLPVEGFADISITDYRDARARGMGGSATDPYCSCAEENLLAYEGDPYSTECIFIHEFAHNIHLRGLANVDATFDQRVKASYGAAMKAGLWKGKYASVNHHEYFAEGVQSWFDDNRQDDHDHNHVNTRAELSAYDPGLAALCREVFGDTELKYTKPTTRLTGNLTGYDPAKAPKFTWPERLEKARVAIREAAKKRSDAANKVVSASAEKNAAKAAATFSKTRVIAGWTLHISAKIDQAALNKALPLLQAQLEEIVRVVPKAAVTELQKVPLWFNPEYPKVRPRAEFHPGADWLRENGRDPAMAKAVEFTNVRVFEAECRRMPNFALHELAHAYHNRTVRMSFGNLEIKNAYQKAKASGKYDRVERKDSEGRSQLDRAYAMTDPQEYFAECTESYFSRNDFFPFIRDELKQHDPEMFELLEKLWGVK
ncbi:MAG: zinc-dependent peptidase [Verrucomicrobia bacterium]|nr:zinc-dependent peptidase [Verrucomicrobiota bacterium]